MLLGVGAIADGLVKHFLSCVKKKPLLMTSRNLLTFPDTNDKLPPVLLIGFLCVQMREAHLAKWASGLAERPVALKCVSPRSWNPPVLLQRTSLWTGSKSLENPNSTVSSTVGSDSLNCFTYGLTDIPYWASASIVSLLTIWRMRKCQVERGVKLRLFPRVILSTNYPVNYGKLENHGKPFFFCVHSFFVAYKFGKVGLSRRRWH